MHNSSIVYADMGTNLDVNALTVFDGLCVLPVLLLLLLLELMQVQPLPFSHLLGGQLHLLAHLGNLLRMLQLHCPHHFALGHFLSAQDSRSC